MSTLLSQAQEKLQNVESSMNFMQNEHAHTLRGLHDEIHKLQTKCSELTFELHMRGDGATSSSCVSCSHKDEIEKIRSKYKTKLSELRCENGKVKSGLDEKVANIKLLEFQLKTAKEDSIECQKKKDHVIKSLRTELENKSDQLAYLMSKLHTAKVMAIKVPTESLPEDLKHDSGGCRRYTPTPPPRIRHGSPRPRSRARSIDFSKSIVNDPITSAAAEILGEQEQKALIVSQSMPLPAIGDRTASRSFLSKMKFNRRRDSKPLIPTVPPPKAK